MAEDLRRAGASFALHNAAGSAVQQGEAVAVIGDDALSIGPLSVSLLDADALRAAEYRIELDIWPDRRLVLAQLSQQRGQG